MLFLTKLDTKTP